MVSRRSTAVKILEKWWRPFRKGIIVVGEYIFPKHLAPVSRSSRTPPSTSSSLLDARKPGCMWLEIFLFAVWATSCPETYLEMPGRGWFRPDHTSGLSFTLLEKTGRVATIASSSLLRVFSAQHSKGEYPWAMRGIATKTVVVYPRQQDPASGYPRRSVDDMSMTYGLLAIACTGSTSRRHTGES